MFTLYLDSSNKYLTVGLAKQDKFVEEISYEAWQRQSENMIPEIDTIMKKNGVAKEDLDSVVVSIGPGSYTGVRISLSIAKVMAVALPIDVYTLSSLHVMAKSGKPSICLINARSARSYIGVYHDEKVILADTVMSNEDVKKYILEHQDYVLCGDLDYLEMTGEKVDIVKAMIKLKKTTIKVDNPLAIKPVYLKENY